MQAADFDPRNTSSDATISAVWDQIVLAFAPAAAAATATAGREREPDIIHAATAWRRCRSLGFDQRPTANSKGKILNGPALSCSLSREGDTSASWSWYGAISSLQSILQNCNDELQPLLRYNRGWTCAVGYGEANRPLPVGGLPDIPSSAPMMGNRLRRQASCILGLIWI